MAKELCLWAPCGMFINYTIRKLLINKFDSNWIIQMFQNLILHFSAPACFGKPKWIAEGTSSKRSQILENFEYEYSYKYEIFGWIFLQVWDILMKILTYIRYFDEYSYMCDIFWWIFLHIWDILMNKPVSNKVCTGLWVRPRWEHRLFLSSGFLSFLLSTVLIDSS